MPQYIALISNMKTFFGDFLLVDNLDVSDDNTLINWYHNYYIIYLTLAFKCLNVFG